MAVLQMVEEVRRPLVRSTSQVVLHLVHAMF